MSGAKSSAAAEPRPRGGVWRPSWSVRGLQRLELTLYPAPVLQDGRRVPRLQPVRPGGARFLSGRVFLKLEWGATWRAE
jgi:hypothetical protein